MTLFTQLSISEDKLKLPSSERRLPSHPKNRYGNPQIHGERFLPFWYERTRYRQYSATYYLLPYRKRQKAKEINEHLWHRQLKYKGFMIAGWFEDFYHLLPYADPIISMHPLLEVTGNKRTQEEFYGFRYS